MDYDNLNTYDGKPVYDGWVDHNYNENTGKLSGIFNNTKLYQFLTT